MSSMKFYNVRKCPWNNSLAHEAYIGNGDQSRCPGELAQADHFNTHRRSAACLTTMFKVAWAGRVMNQMRTQKFQEPEKHEQLRTEREGHKLSDVGR